MAEQFTGRVQVQTEDDGLPTIVLNGNSAQVLVGGNDQVGVITIQDETGTDRVRVRPQRITVLDAAGEVVIELDASSGELQIGASGTRGQITVHDGQGVQTILIGGGDATVELGTAGQDGDLYVKSGEGAETIHLGGDNATVELGASGQDGSLHIRNDQGQETISLDGQNANLRMGGEGADGDVFLFSDAGDRTDTTTATIHAEGEHANLYMGGQGTDGDIWLFAEDGDRADTSTASIHLSGSSGDIILQNADVAEDFDVRDPEAIEPGTVVVIGDDSKLRASTQSYDRRVAGVVTGTGSPRPGIVLGRQASSRSRLPVALVGRVHCLVDATSAPILIGDMLTTSPTPGHAMKADDPTRAHGAVIGKALQCQPEGTGTIPILVALQ
ncbi:MAG: hypothetical protein M3O65_17235 [Actinomycetota bacterium]|nr:hypothetical protein [Actinomycetota bacterium]